MAPRVRKYLEEDEGVQTIERVRQNEKTWLLCSRGRKEQREGARTAIGGTAVGQKGSKTKPLMSVHS